MISTFITLGNLFTNVKNLRKIDEAHCLIFYLLKDFINGSKSLLESSLFTVKSRVCLKILTSRKGKSYLLTNKKQIKKIPVLSLIKSPHVENW